MYISFNRLIINLYLITALLSIYMPIKTIMLYALAFFHYYFGLYFFYTIKNNNYQINIYILLILTSLIISIFMSGTFGHYAIINIFTIFGIYYLIETDATYTIDRLILYIILISSINFFIYLLLPPDYISMKVIAGFILNRIQLDFLPLSITSLLALLAFILSENLKSKMLMYLLKVMNVILIIKLGKLSVIATLLIIYILAHILKRVYPVINKHFLNIFLKIGYTVLFLTALLLVIFKAYFDSDILILFTFRDVIYADFINYTFNHGSLLYGNGFIANSTEISSLSSTNPHNQALGIFFNLGFFGLIIFLLTFLKVLINTVNRLKLGDDIPFKVFFSLSLLMSMDSYFILTVFPLSLLFIMFYLIKLPCSKTPSTYLMKSS